MALNGSVKTNSYNGRYYTLSWTATQSIANNTSTISWTLTANGLGTGWTAERTVYVDIAGARRYEKANRIERYDGTVATGSLTLTHDSAGAKSFSVSIGAAVYGSSVNVTGSNSFTLNTIPRKAEIKSAPDFTDEANPIITYSNPAGNNVTSLEACISFTGAKDDIPYRAISKTGTSYTFNFTDAERATLWSRVTSGSSATVTFFIRTVISGVTYHSTLTKTLTLVNHEPTASGTVENIDEYTLQLTGDNPNVMIRNHNELAYTANAEAHKGATITEVMCSYNNGNRFEMGATGTIKNAYEGTFYFSATDNRGNTTDYTVPVELEVIPYIPLTIGITKQEITMAEDNTIKISFAVEGNCYAGNWGDDTTHNELNIQYMLYEIKEDGTKEEVYANVQNYPIPDENNKYTFSETLTPKLYMDGAGSYKSSYEVHVYAIDALEQTYTISKTLSIYPVFDWGKNDFNFNVPVTIQGNLVADYIVERSTAAMGTNGTWQIEKWASGKAVCYGVRNYGNMAVSNAWGSLYESASFTQSFPSGLFIDAPEHLYIHEMSGSASLQCGFGYSPAPSKDNTGNFFFFRPTAINVSQVHVQFYAIGRWR